MSVKPQPGEGFAVSAPLVIIGAGAAGLCAALAAHEAGVDIIVLERDSVPRGSTALSAGLIPAAGTRFQKSLGIDDSPALFAADLKRKAHDEVDPAIVDIDRPRGGRDGRVAGRSLRFAVLRGARL